MRHIATLYFCARIKALRFRHAPEMCAAYFMNPPKLFRILLLQRLVERVKRLL